MIGPLSGYLLASPDDHSVARRTLDLSGNVTRKIPFLAFEQPFENSRYWEQYTFHSDRAFIDDVARTDIKAPFRYKVYCARSGSKLIVLTEKKKLTDYLIERVLNETIFPNLKHVSFQIDKIISAFQNISSDYRVTSVHGRFSGPDRSLRTVILYGSEVTDSSLFRDSRHLFNYYMCGVAERSPDDPFITGDYGEIARLGNDGSISVQSFNRNKSIGLNKIINHLITNKWVDNWVVPWVGEHE